MAGKKGTKIHVATYAISQTEMIVNICHYGAWHKPADCYYHEDQYTGCLYKTVNYSKTVEHILNKVHDILNVWEGRNSCTLVSSPWQRLLPSTSSKQTRSSAVAEKPRGASCH